MFFFLSILIFIVGLFNLFLFRAQPYTLHKVINVFFIFFFSVAPIVQFNNNITLWGGYKAFTQEDYENTSFILLCIVLFYNVGYLIYRQSYRLKYNRKATFVHTNNLSLSQFTILFILSSFGLLCMLYINNFSIVNLLVRGGELVSERQMIASTTSLVIQNFIRPLGLISLMILIVCKVKNKLLVGIIAILGTLACMPTAISRFMVAALYMPFLFVVFPKLLSKRNLFVFIFIFSLLIVFPFLNNFRYYSIDANTSLGFNYDMFSQEHFDAYSVFMRIHRDNIILDGYQLLGTLFFWVPRFIWPNKPIGSGAYVAGELNLDFANISCPYFAEGYINFGFIGVIVFSVILIIITVKLDCWYWDTLNKTNSIDKIVYYFLLGLTFFIMRGDLLSSIAFTTGILLSFYFVRRLMKI